MSNESGTIKKNNSMSIWTLNKTPLKKWAIYLSDGSLFDTYPTIRAANLDAKKYNITVTG